MEFLKIGAGEGLDGDVEGNWFLAGGVDAYDLCHVGVLFFVGVNAISRMQVERGFEAAFVQGGNEAGRVGEEVAIPGVASPAASGIAGVGEVPIHIHNAHGQRHIVGLKLIHQPSSSACRVSPETAPPVAQCPARNHGRGASDLGKFLQTGVRILPIPKEIEVKVPSGALRGSSQPSSLKTSRWVSS